jgi:3-hydroxymyristoyl/3-hydroxydecanoyl-(acyl carrier protein) dehydratase
LILLKQIRFLHLDQSFIMWYTLENFSVDSDRAITAQARIAADCVWFEGHFPGMPILPGVAQLTLVKDLLNRALERSVTVRGVSRVRFKQMIRPDDTIAVNLTPTDTDAATYGFRLFNGAELVCSGAMTIAA